MPCPSGRHFAYDGSCMTHLVRQPGLEPVESGEFALKAGEGGCAAIRGNFFSLDLKKVLKQIGPVALKTSNM